MPNLKELLEANSVVIAPDLISEKVSAIHIEETLRCVKGWLSEKEALLIKVRENARFGTITFYNGGIDTIGLLIKEIEKLQTSVPDLSKNQGDLK